MVSRKLSTAQVGRMLGASDQSVANWIDQGKLRAGRTPGGHRRVEAEDLIDFLKRQKLRIPAELAPGEPTILIVNGDPSLGARLSEVIKACHPTARVLMAHDGYSAGEYVATERPDVIVLDMGMPGMDGQNICRRIKSRRPTRDATVIAVVENLTPETERAVLDAGASGCLSKPLDVGALRDLLHDCL